MERKVNERKDTNENTNFWPIDYTIPKKETGSSISSSSSSFAKKEKNWMNKKKETNKKNLYLK